jgi:two-component system chemotaxis response regulator CheB
LPNYDVVVIGASAGGVGFLQRLAEGLPADFPAAVFVTLHLPDGARSVLPSILTRAGKLPAHHAQNGEPIRPGQIYIAPPGFHMTLESHGVRVNRGAREHGLRPAIDPLFRSAALTSGARAIGVVLSGLLDDGTVGLLEIKRAGGIAIVQDPEETEWPSMPRSAMNHVDVDYCLHAGEIGGLLHRLVHEGKPAMPTGDKDDDKIEHELNVLTQHEDESDKPGAPSPYSCPECGGVLWELREGEMLRFRCRVGHAYSSESLTTEQATIIEQSLWTALRALEEQAAVKRRLGERAARRGDDATARQLERRRKDLEEHAQRVRDLLMTGVGAADGET